jgi:deazaflavin-dependent oxidoreductase (nitroreductase family)
LAANSDRKESTMNDWNKKIIEEFRANDGRVGGVFEGMPILLLHNTGARTGAERVNPLAYQTVSDGIWAIFASKGGAPTNPDWYYNLKANPAAKIEIGTDEVEVKARVVDGVERARIWEKQKQDRPQFAEYEKKTKGHREIPVVVLERA